MATGRSPAVSVDPHLMLIGAFLVAWLCLIAATAPLNVEKEM
jgi:hypothetical protein